MENTKVVWYAETDSADSRLYCSDILKNIYRAH